MNAVIVRNAVSNRQANPGKSTPKKPGQRQRQLRAGAISLKTAAVILANYASQFQPAGCKQSMKLFQQAADAFTLIPASLGVEGPLPVDDEGGDDTLEGAREFLEQAWTAFRDGAPDDEQSTEYVRVAAAVAVVRAIEREVEFAIQAAA